jgi:hypothetical protein
MHISDQYLIQKQMFRGEDNICLDHDTKLFLSLYRVEDHEIKMIDSNRRVINLLSLESPCVIHANGKSFHFLDIMSQAYN